jgi:hypothetical protein
VEGLQNVVGDARADHLQEHGRRHREAQRQDRLVRFVRRRSALEGVEHDRHQAREHPVDHERRRVRYRHGPLAQALGEGPGRGEGLVV